jgi:hypothetical protein
MESMGKHDGHFSKFALILRNQDRKFVNRIKRLQIDEAQTRHETLIVRVLTVGSVGLPEQTSRYPLQFSVSWKQTLRQMTACKDKERYITGFE